jgi:uncharacterized protein YndB with AHSA1/START domain
MTAGPFERVLRIEARPEIVFAHFTDPARFAQWMGIDHKLDPVPGGVFRVNLNGQDVAAGEFVEVDPPRRIVFTWGWQESAELPPGSTTIEVDLVPDGSGTILHFTHRGLPPGPAESHAQGWDHFLPRLVMTASGTDPGPDPWLSESAPE